MASNREYHIIAGGKLTTGGDSSGKIIDLQRHNQRLFIKKYADGSLMFLWMDEDNGYEYTISIDKEDVETVTAQLDKFFYEMDFELHTAKQENG